MVRVRLMGTEFLFFSENIGSRCEFLAIAVELQFM